MLTKIEKLDGYFPGLATEARMLLDRGIPVTETAKILRDHFPTPVTDSNVRCFRLKRWGPQKDKAEADFCALEVFFKKCGGNYGLDLAAFARVRELMDTTEIMDANSVRLAVVKIRAQDLKEEEFKFKTSRSKPGQTADGQEVDREAQSRMALRRIKEIFGLAGDEPPKPPVRQLPAAAGEGNA
jgi:hypothetical protein